MLYHTVTILAVAICSANAAFVVTALDDAPDQGSLSSVASCNYRACDQLCRRLGFPGGACIGDRCQCDNFAKPQEVNDIPLNDVNSINQDVLNFLPENKPEDNEITVDSESKVHPDVLPATEWPVSEVNTRSSVSRASCDCIDRNCDYYCFRLHYTGGICVTGNCRCYR